MSLGTSCGNGGGRGREGTMEVRGHSEPPPTVKKWYEEEARPRNSTAAYHGHRYTATNPPSQHLVIPPRPYPPMPPPPNLPIPFPPYMLVAPPPYTPMVPSPYPPMRPSPWTPPRQHSPVMPPPGLRQYQYPPISPSPFPLRFRPPRYHATNYPHQNTTNRPQQQSTANHSQQRSTMNDVDCLNTSFVSTSNAHSSVNSDQPVPRSGTDIPPASLQSRRVQTDDLMKCNDECDFNRITTSSGCFCSGLR